MLKRGNDAIRKAQEKILELQEIWPINLDKSFLRVGIKKLEGFIIKEKVDKDEKL